MVQVKGFMAALFDLSFHHFITLKIVQLLYVVLLVLIGLAAFAFLVSSFSYGAYSGQQWIILVALVGTPVIFFLGAILSRIWLEFIIAIFRIAENTESLQNR